MSMGHKIQDINLTTSNDKYPFYTVTSQHMLVRMTGAVTNTNSVVS